jgi:hypothetical protein
MNRLPASPLITRALTLAEERLGIDVLAEKLGANPDMIRTWRHGHATMPDRKFLRLVDILTELDVDWHEPPDPPAG